MNRTHICRSVSTLAITLLVGAPVMADDTEIFFGSSNVSTGSPNIMLILDTSGSMDTLISTTVPYDPNTNYSGNCSNNNVYFKGSGTSTVPTCNSDGTLSNASTSANKWRGYVDKSNFYCSVAKNSGGAFDTAGFYSDAGIRWLTNSTVITKTNTGALVSSTTTYSWSNNLNPADSTTNSGSGSNKKTTAVTYTRGDIACQDHVDLSHYPNGVSPTSSTEWTSVSGNSYWVNGAVSQYTFYTGNYLNWLNEHQVVVTQSRLRIVKTAAENLLDSLSGVNVGLMRYDSKGNGGMVMAPMQSVTTGRAAMKAELETWNPAGNTPLAETLAEAYQYYTGGNVNYGNNSYKHSCTVDSYGNCNGGDLDVLTKSVDISRVGNLLTASKYQSPIVQSCQKNYVVFLTDGLPNQDTSSNTFIDGLSNTDAACSGDGGCLKTLTGYMYNNDLMTSLPDKQNITSYFIGFGSEVSGGAALTYLQDAGQAGGGNAYTAGNLTTLSSVLNDIFIAIKNDSATFTSPSVAVNAFNKTQVLEDLYVSVFQPAQKEHWPGNLKKYKLRDGMVVGQNQANIGSAVDNTTGFFKPAAQSFWSTSVDGSTAAAGGAANLIPDPDNRNVYTYIGTDPTVPSWVDLTSSTNYSLSTTNTLLTDTLLDIGSAGDPAHNTLVNWARGMDTKDDNADGSTTDARHVMGDPIHSQPSVVIYGNTGSTTTQKINDAVVFMATNDGYLHAIDVSSGVELWSFVPQELLGDLKLLYNNTANTTKHYSLDGNLRVLKYDVNNNGIVDTGDRVFLYFSMGRGGTNYYALDVTDKTHPKYMWTLDSTKLSGLVSQSWSTPALGRVRVHGATQNPQRLVLIFGGGYDSLEDAQSYNSSGDTQGNAVFMVDAVRGTVLWSQTKTTSGAFAKMTHAIPSDVAVLDTNGDGWSDRMYVGDMAGQLWRFDIYNDGDPTSTTSPLVTGGVIASLGAKDGTASTAKNRSFYNKPDVSKVVRSDGANFFNIAIGSGDRSFPKSNVTTQDRFYGLRDYHISALSQTDYNALTATLDGDLTTITGTTAATINNYGWKLALDSTQAEKVLAQSVTVNGVAMFTTYLPGGGSSTACSVSSGGGRSYAIDVTTGMKYFTNLYESFATTGLPSQITIVNDADIIRTDGTTASSSSTSSSSSSSSSGAGTGVGVGAGPSTCLSGVVALGKCVEFGQRVKTFWTDKGAE